MIERPAPEATVRAGVLTREVRLMDGKMWGLACPTVRISPRVETDIDALGRPVERIEVDFGVGYPWDIEHLLDQFSDARSRRSVSEQYESFLSLAVALLRRAHDIDSAAARELLTVVDDDLPALVKSVLEMISEVDQVLRDPLLRPT